MKYFEVAAKCGHVGRMYYYEGHFFVASENKKQAAGTVRMMPRVKKDHDDVILWVREIDRQEYLLGLEEMKYNPYFNCGSKYQQREIFDEIQDDIHPETDIQMEYRKSNGYYQDKNKKHNNSKVIRNPYKYAKFNKLTELEYYVA